MRKVLMGLVLSLFLVACGGAGDNPTEVWLITWQDGSTKEVTAYCDVEPYTAARGFLGGADVEAGNSVFVTCSDGPYQRPVFATQAFMAERIDR